MKRRSRHEASVSHDRWLVSYADLITLLFALFVILYATSQANLDKFKAVHDSLKQAFDGPAPKKPGAGGALNDGTGIPGAGPDYSLAKTKEMIEQSFSAEGGGADLADKVRVIEDERGLVVRMSAKDFFDDGSAEVRRELLPLIVRIGRILSKVPNNIRVEGYTDAIEDRELGKNHDVWPSDWELSASRATWIVRYWIEQQGMAPERLSAIGFSHYHPLTDKTDDWSRGLNRRVEVVVLQK